MIVDRDQIVAGLKAIWPDMLQAHSVAVGNIYIPRNRYYAPTRKQFENMVDATWNSIAKNVPYTPDLFMCSNFAATLAVVADFYVLQLQALNQLDPKVAAEWCVGETWGIKFHGDLMGHAVCLMGLDIDNRLEFWFFEPQPQRKADGSIDFLAWKADSQSNKIHFFKL